MNEKKSEINNKSTCALIVSIIAILLCLLVFGLWIFEVIPLAVISADTFIGACVTLMSIIVTIAVGWQIYNALDLQEKIRTIEGVQIELKQSKHLFKQADIKNAFYHNLSLALCSQISTDYVSAFRFFEQALMHTLQLEEPVNVLATMSSLSNCAKLITKEQTIPSDKYKEIMVADKAIKASKLYAVLQEEYEKSIKIFLSKVHV